jgi:hypothetical protein
LLLFLQASRDLSRLSERNQPSCSEPFRSQQPLLLLPPIFSKQDMPVAFAFRDQPPPKGETSNGSNSRALWGVLFEQNRPVFVWTQAAGRWRGQQQLQCTA